MNSLPINLFGLLVSLLFLYISLPANAYHGITIVMGIFIISSCIFWGLGKLLILLLSKKHSNNNLSPLLFISLVLGSIASAAIFYMNIKEPRSLDTKNDLYVPRYEVPVNMTDCKTKSKSKSRREGLLPSNCSIDIKSINKVIGSLIIENTFETAELHCIKFDIDEGELGLPYAHSLMTCDQLRNKQRVQSYWNSAQ